jgi:hypothetical protein
MPVPLFDVIIIPVVKVEFLEFIVIKTSLIEAEPA